MRRVSWRTILLTGLASLGITGSVNAQGSYGSASDFSDDPPGSRQISAHGRFWPPQARPVGKKQSFIHAYHYAHYWPYPHNCEDRDYTYNIMDIQAANGWLSATTLHDYHFDADTQKLTEGGRSHLLWVAQSVPSQYRTVYVSQGDSREMAQLRLQITEQFYRDMGIPNPPPILARAEVFVGRPAVEVDRIRQLELQSIPRQRLFFIGSATSASMGGGVSGGALGGGNVGGPNGVPAGQGATTVR